MAVLDSGPHSAMFCLLQIDGIAPTDVESTSVSLTPQIDYGSDGNTQNITGDSLKRNLCLVGLSS